MPFGSIQVVLECNIRGIFRDLGYAWVRRTFSIFMLDMSSATIA